MSSVVVTQGTTRTVQVATAGPQGVRGAQGWVWRGAWDVDTDYAAAVTVGGVVTVGADVVSHDGSAWLAVADSTGVEPSALAAEWELVAAKGDTGPQGEVTEAELAAGLAAKASTSHAATHAAAGSDPVTITPAQVSGTAVVTTDSRLSDARTPVAHSHAPADVTGTAVITTDARLSDARTPTAHAGTHAAAGSDPLTLSQSQVTNLTADLAAKAPLASPTLTGVPVAPTAAVDTATTQVATTAFVVAQAASATPVMDGVGAAGTATRLARADHVHPSDTSRAALAGAAFAGAVTMATTLGVTGALTVGSESPSATLGADLGSGSGLTQTVTTVIGATYQVGATGVTAITLDGAALAVSGGYSSFVATATSHVLAGTGGSGPLTVRQITLGSVPALAAIGGMECRRRGTSLAMGYHAQRSLTTGSTNSAVGYYAQYSLTTGSSNNAVGYYAQYYLTTGSSNSAVGYVAQRSLTTGSYNSAVGHLAQYSLTTGLYNSAVGHIAQYSLTTGLYNSAVGHAAQRSPKGNTANATTTASNQTAVGAESGQYSAATGDKGTALGYRAIYHTGAVAVGADSEAQGVDSIAIGRGAIAAADNTIQIGSSGVAYVMRFGSAGRVVGLNELKSIVAAASTWAAFQSAVAALS